MRIRVLSSVSAWAQFVVNIIVRAAEAVAPSALARTVCDVATHAHNVANTGESLAILIRVPCAPQLSSTHALCCMVSVASAACHPRALLCCHACRSLLRWGPRCQFWW